MMKSTVALTSRAASIVDATGVPWPGSPSMEAGRVERLYPRTSTSHTSQPRAASMSIIEAPPTGRSNEVSAG